MALRLTIITNWQIAIITDPQQFDIKDLSTSRPGLLNAGLEDDHAATKCTCHGEENTPLLGNTTQRQAGCYAKVKLKFQSRHCCLWSSKAALLVLVWNLSIYFGLLCFFDPSLYTSIFIQLGSSSFIFTGLSYSSSAFLLVFYPLAGCLADIRWGRHTTVVNSLYFSFWSLVSILVVGGLAIIAFIPIIVYNPYTLSKVQTITIIVLCIVFGLVIFFGAILLLCSLVAFSANVIQFGIDQLHDAPTDDSVLLVCVD